MDALFVFQHSQADDLEIRYALRGIAKYLPFIRKVWIFGDRPEFLSDDTTRIEHVPHADVARLDGSPVPIRNFFKMIFLSSLIGDLDAEYLWFCDDFIVIDHVAEPEMRKTRYIEDLGECKSRGKGLWMGSLWRTYDLLKRLGYTGYNFEIHAPTYFRKRWVFDAYCDFKDFITNDRWQGMLGPTAILNHAYKQHQMPLTRLSDEGWKVGWHGQQPSHAEVVEKTRGKRFLNFDDEAFGDGLRQFLTEHFPAPCVFEAGGHHEAEQPVLGSEAARNWSFSTDTSGAGVLPATPVMASGVDVVHESRPLTPQPSRELQLRMAGPAPSTSLGPSPSELPAANNFLRFPPVVIPSRDDFGEYLNRLGLMGDGVEIGTLRGDFAVKLLQKWKGRRLHCVDPWRSMQEDARYIDRNNVSQVQHDHNQAHARHRLAKFADRCHIHRTDSREAALQFADRTLDFVYLDARHYREALLEDLDLWSRKVRPGGLLSGHDYLDGVLPSGHFEVKSTVDAWATEHGLEVQCSGEHVWRSWFIVLPNKGS